VRMSKRPLIFGVCLAIMSGSLSLGCATIPPPTVSPVEIEETREDIKILEKDLATARSRAQALTTELNAKKADLDGKKDKPAKLKKKLKNLKKGSGRDDKQKKKKKKDEKESA